MRIRETHGLLCLVKKTTEFCNLLKLSIETKQGFTFQSTRFPSKVYILLHHNCLSFIINVEPAEHFKAP